MSSDSLEIVVPEETPEVRVECADTEPKKVTEAEKKLKRFETDAMLPLITKIALPTAVSFGFDAIYSVVDSIFVGRLDSTSDTPLSALAVCTSVELLMYTLPGAIAFGGTPLLSKSLGKDTKEGLEEASRIMAHIIAFGVLICLLQPIVMWFALPGLLHLVGATELTYDLCMSYTRITCTVGPLSYFLSGAVGPILRAENRATLAMARLMVSVALNAAMDPLWMFVLGYGFKGAAISTVLSEMLVGLWMTSFYVGPFRRSAMTPGFRHLRRLDWRLGGRMIGLGGGIIGMTLLSAATALISNVLFTTLPDTELWQGALGVTNRVLLLVQLPVMAISGTLVPIAGYNLGKSRFDRVYLCLKYLGGFSCLLSSFVECVLLLAAPVIAKAFTASEELRGAIAWCVRVVSLSLIVSPLPPLCGSVFQLEERMVASAFSSSVGRYSLMLLLQLPLLLWGEDPRTVVWAVMAADALISLPHVVVYLRQLTAARRKWKEAEQKEVV
eukprot:gnl/Dysnectes_brevis/4886_a6784_398.p1 GENE.gnl/Dysnectes_brevis/4886_a6784_398~~gnl/Dysnectes_brevis/4886_a6784_398.p1  ORF type:complete len:499 (-),score=159.25 gnl/Dysnectes_brevis/4886_a6784_398:71-1567(-)